ncbi:MAG: helix-turn-helix domain-containing protein [Clostridia bacterium]|nr:helix-turn-helix domain-containing protein [Clostridia bacterium]
MRDIGKNIRSVRIRRRMTQDELAEKLYVTRQTVSNYETGRSRPDVEVLMQIAEILGVEMQELLYGPEETPEKKQAKKRLFIACGILAVLGILYLCTYRQIGIWASKYYYTMLRMWIHGFFVPLWFGLFGWAVLQACGVYLGARMPQGKAMRWIYLAVLVCLSACVVLLLPNFCMISVYAVRELIAILTDVRHSGSTSLEFLPIWDRIATKLLFFLCRCPYVTALVGAALWLVGFPSRKTNK